MTADDIRTRLDAIDAYCAAATEGPWALMGNMRPEVQRVTNAAALVIAETFWGGDGNGPDAAFIAAARTDLPAVVAALRDALAYGDALAAENARLRAQVQAVEALCDEREATSALIGMQSIDFFGNPFPLLVTVDDVRAALATTEAGAES